MNKCVDCKLNCPVQGQPENVAMEEACRALIEWCNDEIPPESPMCWLRGYLEGKK